MSLNTGAAAMSLHFLASEGIMEFYQLGMEKYG